MKQPTAELIGKPENPIGLLYYIWMQSRSNNDIQHPVDYELASMFFEKRTRNKLGEPTETAEALHSYSLGADIVNTVKQLLDEDIPVLENLHFTFALTNIPVSLREQLVRHRVGVQVGPLQGLDQIPELGSSSFWSQTSRMVPMSDFADEERYLTPESVGEGPSSFEELYVGFMEQAQSVYNTLIEAGVPMEDARQVLPLAATQSLTWTMSLKTIIHVIGKRACWIAQYGLWGKIITDIARELRDKVSPLLHGIVQPPCMKKGKFVSCPIHIINIDRLKGIDPYPPCPLWARYEPMIEQHTDNVWEINGLGLYTTNSDQKELMARMTGQFKAAWQLDPETGLPLPTP